MPPNTQLERSVQPRTGRGRLVGWGGSLRRERWPGGGRAHRAEKTSSSTRHYRAGAHTLQIERAAMCGEGGQRGAPPCREEGATQPVSPGAAGSRLGGRFLVQVGRAHGRQRNPRYLLARLRRPGHTLGCHHRATHQGRAFQRQAALGLQRG